MEILIMLIFLSIIWGFKILGYMLAIAMALVKLVLFDIPVAIIKAVKKSREPEESEATQVVEVNVTVTYVDDMGNKSVVQKKRDIYPFSDDENDIGYNLEMADILFGDD
ncbi:MAG: hypothetical protein MJ171_05595 [Clostridia bacterium]|nr:hypothetical protein [Clostridia bacterium]